MPFGKDGVSADDLACREAWATDIARHPLLSGGIYGFDPADAASVLAKVKGLLDGGAPSAVELATLKADERALHRLIEGWMEEPGFERAMKDFLEVALQQRIKGSLDAMLNPQVSAEVESNFRESFAWDIWLAGPEHELFAKAWVQKLCY